MKIENGIIDLGDIIIHDSPEARTIVQALDRTRNEAYQLRQDKKTLEETLNKIGDVLGSEVFSDLKTAEQHYWFMVMLTLVQNTLSNLEDTQNEPALPQP